jgi:acyl-coenzyme A synthetase/AMP-(fatty) acid ligase
MWDIIIIELRELAVTVLVALLSLGATYALAYIRRAKEALDQRINHELVDRALERVAYLAEVAVLAAESTTAAALRQAVAEGKANRDELLALGRQVVEQVLTQLDTEARQALSETVGDIRRYVESVVEATLERLKVQGIVGRVADLADPKL